MRTDYQIIAPVYQKLMSHVDYSMWAEYLLKCFELNKHQPSRVLELAGGTADLAQELQGKFEYFVGSDLHPQMVAQQDAKLFDERLCLDMANIPLAKDSFDTLFCLYDSFNYLCLPEEKQGFFESAFKVLSPGGLLVFDSVTEHNCLEYFADSLDYEEWTEGDLVREAWYDEENCLQHTRFIFYTTQDQVSWMKSTESHLQKIWNIDQIKESVQSVGFEIEAIYDGFTHEDIHDKTERMHWVLRKPQ